MKELNGELSFNQKERAYCKGWNEIYALSDEYYHKLASNHTAILKQVAKDLKKDVMSLQSDEWQNSFDQSCELVTKMTGVSELELFVCIPIYKEEMIAACETEKQAYDAGKHQAFYKLHTVLFNSIEALNLEASKMETEKYEEMKLKLSGAMHLLLELSSITGFEILGGMEG